ncbi:hypothetical protein [Staphylococcus chromogenes]|uniref:hypothetical protein n=1 Tax=Staphylococcus chromogenes TaxID=46126 RepID=UPI0028861A4D|nr:hypothetical protein [Staphylococcus chromogenes]MDT0670682.1 hypothetical protein [Staphylococcus chromogenes]
MKVRFKDELYDLEYSSERYNLHETVNEIFYEVSGEIEFEDELEELETEVDLIHKAISAKNVKALESLSIDTLEEYYSFEIVRESLKEVLESNGYEVSESKASLSLYVINDNNEEVRMADHKRPAYTTNGLDYHEHEYGQELVNKKGEFTKEELKSVGLRVDSEEGVFYL